MNSAAIDWLQFHVTNDISGEHIFKLIGNPFKGPHTHLRKVRPTRQLQLDRPTFQCVWGLPTLSEERWIKYIEIQNSQSMCFP